MLKHCVLLSSVLLPAVAAAGQFIPASESPIPGQYIVVLAQTPGQAQPSPAARRTRIAELARAQRGTLTEVFDRVLNGGVVRMSEAGARALAGNPQVAYVEQDRNVRLTPPQFQALATSTQVSVPSWGLDRIDQRQRPLSGTYAFSYTGLGVTAYVLDTGIRTTHVDFGGRARVGFDAVNDGRAGQDCNGHGTHVAGTIGGQQYGVAKAVSLVAVRVLDCKGSGTLSGVISGVDWVTRQTARPAVANMSLGGGASTSIDNAVKSSIAAGITYVLAAGNENTDACKRSPARVAEGLTVAASTSTDARASYSNHGRCVDLFGPGSSINAPWYTSDSAAATLSGTSMAAPHVAGVAALYLQTRPAAAPSTVHSAVVAASTSKVLSGVSGTTANRLLYSLLP